jgi:hypothetical protein
VIESSPGFPAVVKVSRKMAGIVLGSLGVVIGVGAGWYAGWVTGFLLLLPFLVFAVLSYSGLSNESNVSIARGYVFVYPKRMNTGGVELWQEAICKPKTIKEEGDAVLVSSGGSQLRIVFENETERASFISEVSGLLSANSV